MDHDAVRSGFMTRVWPGASTGRSCHRTPPRACLVPPSVSFDRCSSTMIGAIPASPERTCPLYKECNRIGGPPRLSVPKLTPTTSRYVSPWNLTAVLCALLAFAHGQTASTGSLIGFVLDPSGSVVPGVILHLTAQASGESHSAVSDKDGRFSFSLLRPGRYQLQISKAQFDPLTISEVNISVTETQRVEVHLRLAPVFEQTQVSSELPIVQTDNSTLGRTVANGELISLPLVTRNVAEIVGISPGVTAGVFNAGELGLGGIALSQIANSNDGIFAHGDVEYENVGPAGLGELNSLFAVPCDSNDLKVAPDQ